MRRSARRENGSALKTRKDCPTIGIPALAVGEAFSFYVHIIVLPPPFPVSLFSLSLFRRLLALSFYRLFFFLYLSFLFFFLSHISFFMFLFFYIRFPSRSLTLSLPLSLFFLFPHNLIFTGRFHFLRSTVCLTNLDSVWKEPADFTEVGEPAAEAVEETRPTKEDAQYEPE